MTKDQMQMKPNPDRTSDMLRKAFDVRAELISLKNQLSKDEEAVRNFKNASQDNLQSVRRNAFKMKRRINWDTARAFEQAQAFHRNLNRDR